MVRCPCGKLSDEIRGSGSNYNVREIKLSGKCSDLSEVRSMALYWFPGQLGMESGRKVMALVDCRENQGINSSHSVREVRHHAFQMNMESIIHRERMRVDASLVAEGCYCSWSNEMEIGQERADSGIKLPRSILHRESTIYVLL